MPSEGPGSRYSVVATKATQHGRPAIENKHPGVAAKSAQAAPAYPSVANAATAKNIAIGEEFVIMLTGLHEILSSLLPGGAVAGTQLWIVEADNTLQNAAGAGRVKWGVVSSIDATLGRALVNLNLRDTF